MSARSSTRARAALLAAALALGSCKSAKDKEATAASGPVTTVAAAASLRGVLPTLIARFAATAKTPANISVTYGASGSLRRQVEGGAPVDLVLFAARSPVDQLAEKGLLEGASVRLATNTLVLIASAADKTTPPLTFATLDRIPDSGHLAIGEPGSVPAGAYAKVALQKLGSWDALQDRLVFAGDVAAVLAYARRGEVAAAIVYETETAGIGDIVVLDRASAEWAPTAEVVGAATRGGLHTAGGKAFLEWLRTPEAQEILAAAGFGPP